jgi:hypothetical protein
MSHEIQFGALHRSRRCDSAIVSFHFTRKTRSPEKLDSEKNTGRNIGKNLRADQGLFQGSEMINMTEADARKSKGEKRSIALTEDQGRS